ncbi:RAMP superfamily CRISPR-associated protein [Coleofasciculus sp. H7-2]|uniref:RAMP superfamily CRISPR-associated protein n=1 Tax=Coleofasciculus sp. H7-2 TaxID=3351545 RepID=UPI00366FC8DF
MYHKAYGIIETQAPLHVGASAGEESGNLNLIFRDQFTQTGIIPGSSIRGRFRADMRGQNSTETNKWYGHEAIAEPGQKDGGTTEAMVKFEYASLVWLPVFCPGQPIVWVSCPLLLKRYQQITKIETSIPLPYTASPGLKARVVPEEVNEEINQAKPGVSPAKPGVNQAKSGVNQAKSGVSQAKPGVNQRKKVLFFNLGFLEIDHEVDLSPWIPTGTDLDPNQLVVVHNNDIAQLHDMALYRQSRVKLLDDMKKVDTEKGAFFNVEALPVGSILIFPLALKQKGWKPFKASEPNQSYTEELYFGGLESIGFGRCKVTLAGDGFNVSETETETQEANH